MNKNKQVEISFKTSGNGHLVDREKALNIYRVVQELMNNILKHAQATEVQISYHSTPTLLSIDVEDDGNGLLLDTLEQFRRKTGSLGLKNIESRLNIIGGSINFAKRAPSGTVAQIRVENYQPGIA